MTELTMTSRDHLTKLALTLEGDIEAENQWDQPHRLYVVAGTLEDPYLVRLLDIPLDFHPCEVLQEVWDSGRRLRPDALGIALVNEGYRHLELEELEEIAPETIAAARQAAKEIFPDLPDDEREQVIKQNFRKIQMGILPSSVPEQMRREVRQVSFVIKDVPTFATMRTRGDAKATVVGMDERETAGGRIPQFMRQFVNGERPHDSEEESNDLPPTGSVN